MVQSWRTRAALRGLKAGVEIGVHFSHMTGTIMDWFGRRGPEGREPYSAVMRTSILKKIKTLKKFLGKDVQ